MARLHVTNGDAAGDRLAAVMAPEPVLPWRDMLHDGPVRSGLEVEALAAERAAFLAGRFALDFGEPRRQLVARDADLAAAVARGDEVVLWFEHDLYDQLQLLQVLDRLPPGQSARLAQADDYLHRLDEPALTALGAAAPRVSAGQRSLARAAWSAFTAPTPEPLVDLLARDLDPLPWLRPAIHRLLEELPAPGTGLSRTERQALELLEGGPLGPGELFHRARALDEPWFMGDWPFFGILDELAAPPAPLVEGLPAAGFRGRGDETGRHAYLAAAARLTDLGAAALTGGFDRATGKPLDRWLGGTHLTSVCIWRWNAAAGRLERDSAPRV